MPKFSRNQIQSIIIKRSFLAKILLLSTVSILIGFWISRSTTQIIFLMVGIFVVDLWLLNPLWGIIVLLVVRSSLDLLTRYELISLGRIAVFNISALLTIILILFCIIWLLTHRSKWFKGRIAKAFLFFLLASCISLPFSINLIVSLVDLLRLSSMFLLFLIITELIKSPKYVCLLASAIALSSLVPLSLGAYSILKGLHGYALNSTFVNANSFAHYLVLIFPILLRETTESRYRVFWLAISLLLIVELFFTFIRTAWAAFLVILGLIMFLKYKKVKVRIPILSLLIIFIILGVLLFRFGEIAEQRVTIAFSDDPEVSSFATRMIIWRAAIVEIDHSWWEIILGRGLSTFYDHISRISYHRLSASLAHNDYLRLWIETGIIGIAFYIFLMYQVLRKALKFTFDRNSSKFVQEWGAITLLCTIGVLVMQLTDNLLTGNVLQWYYWTTVAIMVSSNRISPSQINLETQRDFVYK